MASVHIVRDVIVYGASNLYAVHSYITVLTLIAFTAQKMRRNDPNTGCLIVAVKKF